ncbi:MAG: glycoside hydrolase domain-containing protein [bacterium]
MPLYGERAQFYKNVFHSAAGFMRGKRNGIWMEPFAPNAVTFEYTEANAWQYSFFAPHDVQGLVTLMGGNEAFIDCGQMSAWYVFSAMEFYPVCPGQDIYVNGD